MRNLKTKIFSIKIFLSSLIILGLGFQSYAQNNQTIKGTVTDSRNGSPLSGATISIGGTNYATATNDQGKYIINASLRDGTYTITVTFTGYATVAKLLNLQRSEIEYNVALSQSAINLGEVVVTGTAGEVTRKQLGNAISTVSGSDLQKGLATSIDQALTGKVAGAEITQNSGNPDGGISVRLRGASTISGSSDPLYIIDGVIINNSSNALVDLGGYSENRLADINPADIDHIEIIKGAAGAAIYGSRASNGVVQIFTKRGRAGKPVVTVSTKFFSNEIRKKLSYNTYPFAFTNTNINDKTQIPVTRYDLQNLIFDKGHGTEDNLSLSGGSENTQYYISSAYLYNQGIVKSTDFKRGNLRIRIDSRINNWLKVTSGLTYSYDVANQMPNGGINEQYGALTGFIFGRNDINPFPDSTGKYPTLSPAGLQRTNPLEAINKFKFEQKTSRIIGNVGLEVDPIDHLKINYTLGYDYATTIQTGYIPIGNTTPSYNTGFSRKGTESALFMNSDINANYKITIGTWLESNSAIGGTVQTSTLDRTILQGTQLSPVSQVASSGATISSVDFRSTLNIMGVYAQQTFGFNHVAYVTGAVRYDVSSSFGESDRGQYYPKMSATYLISEQSFWKNSSLSQIIPDLKIRASYGQNGNLTAIGAYDRFTNYNSVSLPGLPGLVAPNQLGNSNIKPERQTEKEIGMDANFLNNRVGFEFTYYKKSVKDLLLPVTLRPSTGFATQFQNIGDMTNNGVELLVRGIPVQTKNFQWNATFIYSANRNKVFNIPGGLVTFPNGFGVVAAIEGYPLGEYYGTYAARNPDGTLFLLPNGLPTQEKTGHDQNGTPTGSTVRKGLGNNNPKWTGSLINEIEIGHNWLIRMQWDGSFGGEVFDFTNRVGSRDLYGGLAGYMPELEGKVPKGYSAAIYNSFDMWIESGSFAKLREISVTYDLRLKSLNNKPLRISVYGRNLLAITKYIGMDPETNAAGQSTAVRGFDFIEVPIPRQYALGLSYTF